MSLKFIEVEKQEYALRYSPEEISPDIYLHQIENSKKPLEELPEMSPEQKVPSYESEIVISPELTQKVTVDYIVKPREVPLSERIIEQPISPIHYTHSGLERRLYVPWHIKEPWSSQTSNNYSGSSHISTLPYYRR